MKLQNVKKDEKWASASQWSMIWSEGVTNSGGNGNMILSTANGSANYFWDDSIKAAPPATSVKNPNDRETVRLIFRFLAQRVCVCLHNEFLSLLTPSIILATIVDHAAAIGRLNSI